MLSGTSIQHVKQDIGKVFDKGKLSGYYNDLTAKVTDDPKMMKKRNNAQNGLCAIKPKTARGKISNLNFRIIRILRWLRSSGVTTSQGIQGE